MGDGAGPPCGKVYKENIRNESSCDFENPLINLAIPFLLPIIIADLLAGDSCPSGNPGKGSP